MKNLKSIVSTIVLTGILAINSFAGVMISDSLKDQENNKSQQCTTEKDGVIVYGVIVYSLISSAIGLNGVIVHSVEPACDTNQKQGVMISD